MIWYRHWLELRYRLLAAALAALLVHLFFPFGVHGLTAFFRETGKLGEEVRDAQPLLAAMGAERLIAWGVHVQLSTLTSILATLLLAGSSFRMMNTWGVGQGIDTYSATLPVSRTDLDATRLTAAFGGVSAIAFGACFVDAVFLLLTGHSVPLVPMLRASLTGAMLLLPLLALLSLSMISTWSMMLLAFPAPLMAVWGYPAMRSFLLDPDRAHVAAMLALPLTVILFMAGLWLRRWKEL